MADEHIIKRSPFEAPKGNDAPDNNNTDTSPLITRVDFGVPPTKPAETTKPAEPSKPADSNPKANDASKPADRASDAPRAASPVDTKTIYDIQNTYKEIQNLQQIMIQTCFDKQPDGSLKPKTGKISDGNGGMVEVEAVQSVLLSRMSEKYELAIGQADTSMKNPDSAIAATMSTQKQLTAATEHTQKLKTDLEKQGIKVEVGGYLDAQLVSRYMEDNKSLNPAQKTQLNALKESIEKQATLEAKYRDLRILQDTPIVTRQQYAEFLRGVGLPNAANKWQEEARKVGEELNSPSGRSEFAKRMYEQTKSEKDSSLDKIIKEKYLDSPNNPFPLIDSASKKAAAGDMEGARKDMQEARARAEKGFPDLEKDTAAFQKQAEQLKKDREALDAKLKDGTATPFEVARQHERELKLVNEAQILDAMKLAKPKTEIAYADFLLNADKDKGSESNRKHARDILMNVRFDDLGKAAAAQSGEQFDALVEQSLNGNVDNRASMVAFNKAMQEYDRLKQQATTRKDDEDIVKDLQAARTKAAEAAQIAGRINRDGAEDNQRVIKQSLQKQIDAEMAKPAVDRDNGKIKLLQTVMKPSHLLNAQEKELVAGLTEMMKPEKDANKALVDKVANSVKDKNALFDAVSSYSMIQQMEFQKQALNQARIAMLDIDIAFQKGENNPLVGEIERDKYGGAIIQSLNSIPGHDGRTQWGDIKEATRERGTGEKVWNWFKGALKEIAISLASWTVGALAGVGAAALFSWTGPGAIIGGGAVGFAAGAATGSAIRAMIGDKVTLTSAALDGISGMTGGITGTTYAVARGAGSAAIKNVVAQQAEKGITLGTNQTWNAFKAAGMADKFRIAAGGSPFLASFSASTAGSIAYRYPSEALTGNYKTVGDWATGSTLKVASDVPGNLFGSWIGGKFGNAVESKVLANGGSFHTSFNKQLTTNFLWNSQPGKQLFGGEAPRARRSEFNAPVYDLIGPKPEDPNK